MADDTRSEQCLPIEYPMADREGFYLANASVCEKFASHAHFYQPTPIPDYLQNEKPNLA